MSPFDRLLKIMLQPWVALSYIGFVVLSFLYFDKPVAYFFHGLGLKAKIPLLSAVTMVGVGIVYIIGFFLMALFFRFIHRNKEYETRSWFLWLCVLVPNLICLVLKMLHGRARPELLFDSQLYGFYGLHVTRAFWSFPSGHTTTIMGLVFGLCIVFPRHCLAFLLSGFFLILTRVILTQHYLSDVMTTAYITLVEVGLLLLVLRHKAWLSPVYRGVHEKAS